MKSRAKFLASRNPHFCEMLFDQHIGLTKQHLRVVDSHAHDFLARRASEVLAALPLEHSARQADGADNLRHADALASMLADKADGLHDVGIVRWRVFPSICGR